MGHLQSSVVFNVQVNETTVFFTWGARWAGDRSIGCYVIGGEPLEIESTRGFVDFMDAIEAAEGLLWFTARSRQNVEDDVIGPFNVTTLETTPTSMLQNVTSDEALRSECSVQTLRVVLSILLKEEKEFRQWESRHWLVCWKSTRCLKSLIISSGFGCDVCWMEYHWRAVLLCLPTLGRKRQGRAPVASGRCRGDVGSPSGVIICSLRQ